MSAGKYNILIQQGSTFFKQIVLRGNDSVPVDLTGATIMSQVRETYDSVTPLATMVTAIPTPANGTFTLTIADTVTAAMDFTTGVYDVEVHYADGSVDRVLEGKVVFSKEVTR